MTDKSESLPALDKSESLPALDNNAQLHSRYNPEAEAVRYINSLELNNSIKYFILIEPGKGYIIPVLQQKFPNSKIIALHVNDPDTEKILEQEIPAIESSFIKIIEWRPSMNYYKEDYVKLLSVAVKFIKRLDAEKRTVSAFGERWVRNFFKNLDNMQSALLYKETDIPVIITGSGPSLNDAIPLIKEAQDNCLIIAASSSVMALNHYGIKPDLVIATDGGQWALKHLHALVRADIICPLPLAVNLTAALPSQCAAIPQLILNDGSLWQNIVLRELQLPSALVPQRGTVTASAVDLALLLTATHIYLAGTDLAVNDIQTHVKPYAFDNLFYEKADRFNPFYSQCFIRSRQLKDGGSLDIYAQWFKGQYNKWPQRVFNIEKINISRSSAAAQRKDDYFKAVPVNNKDAVDILINNLTNEVRKELIPLIGEDIEKWLTTHI